MAAYLPFIIPILTFALGAVLTLLLKRQDRNVSAVSTYAKDFRIPSRFRRGCHP